MNWWQRWRRRRDEADLDRELRYHIERRIQDHTDAGLSRAEAQRRVRLEFGDVELAKDECRDVRPMAWFDDLGRDVRIGFRGLRREPLFAFSITLILALGIGTCAAMVSVLETVVLQPLPYAQPDELAVVSTHLIARNQWDGTSVPNFLDWRRQSRTFAALSCYRRTSASAVTYVVGDLPRRTREGAVCRDFFTMLGTATLLGRTFTGDEFDRGDHVVILSEAIWQEDFGRSADVIGRRVNVGGAEYTVIGVMPRRFELPTADVGLWRPISSSSWWQNAQAGRDGDGIEVLGRLRNDKTLDAARTEMRGIASSLRDGYPENRDLDVTVVSLFDRLVGVGTARGVWLGFAAVLSLSLIAAANGGGLLLARGARRRREFAVRTALGAGRARLMRQLVAEGLSLWLVASVAGLLIAAAIVQLLATYGTAMLARLDEIALSPGAALSAAAAACLVVLACGTLPARSVAREWEVGTLRLRDRSSLKSRRWQDALVASQFGGAILLLLAAALFGQSFMRASAEVPGYPADELLIARIDLPGPGYDGLAGRAHYFDQAVERLSRLPGVVSIGAINDFFMRRNADQRVTAEGRTLADNAGAVPRLSIESVTPGFFRALGIDVIDGRDFDRRDLDTGAANVLIVNERLARRLWPGESAVGKRLVQGSTPPSDGRWSTVIGVLRDMRQEGLEQEPILAAFVPTYLRGMDLMIRVSPAQIAPVGALAKAELQAIDSAVPLAQITMVQDRLANGLAPRRFEIQTLSVFAFIGILLSMAGLYASLSYHVTMRTREIGIRSALGADRGRIVRMILGKALRLASIGAVVGLASAALGARLIQSLLYQTSALDLSIYVGTTLLVLIVAAAAALAPALRGARISPTRALRQD